MRYMNTSLNHIKSAGERWLRQQLFLFSDEFREAQAPINRTSQAEDQPSRNNRYQVIGLNYQLQHCRAFYPEDREDYFTEETRRFKQVYQKQCYHNAQILALDDPSLEYYEGFYVTSNLPIPINHGFCVRDGVTLIDPTVEKFGIDTLEWYGMPIPSKYWRNKISETGQAAAVLYPFINDEIRAGNIVLPKTKGHDYG